MTDTTPIEAIPYCIYHANCADGFGAAWAFSQELIGATYYPAQYQTPPPLLVTLADKDVYILDFSFPLRDMLDIVSVANTVTVLDHHKTAEGVLVPLLAAGKIGGKFHKHKSGAVLTWEYLHTDPVPLLLQYVQDRDLWRFELPRSKAISAWIRSYPFNFSAWDEMARLIDTRFDQIADEGDALLRAQEIHVDKQCMNAREIVTPHFTCPGLNATYLVSEIGHQLAGSQGMSLTYFIAPDGDVKCSLRSGPCGPDVAELAQRFGGGGHRSAAGFSVPLSVFQRWLANFVER